MWKRVWLRLLVAVVGSGLISAQSLTDQFQLLRPGLTARELAVGRLDSFNLEHRIDMRNIPPLKPVALGGFYQIGVRRLHGPQPQTCNTLLNNTIDEYVFEIERRTTASTEVIVRVPFCVEVSTTEHDAEATVLNNMIIDAIKGRIFIAVEISLHNICSTFDPSCANATGRMGAVVVDGLPTLLDIIPTFQPAGETLSWVTPKHPEALPAADRFMVYAGDIAALREDGDFTRAVPVDCQVPDVGVPSPGEFLSILDPLQVDPGQTNYALVGVEHHGRLRLGRKSTGGVLTGREPSGFPGCG